MSAPTRMLCAALSRSVELYETTDLRTLQAILFGLTIAAVLNALLSLVACLLPRRHLAKGVVLSLLVLPVLILVPFLILNARRDAMHLSRFNVRSAPELRAQNELCHKHGLPSAQLIPHVRYDFSDNMRRDAWQLYVVLLFAGATAALGARISLALAASALVRDRAHSIPAAVELHTQAEVEALLTRLRVAVSNDELRDVQCAICLDDINTAGGEVSRLECAHAYHEVCFAKWVNTAADARCPMCKAPVWPDNAGRSERRLSWEGSRSLSISSITTHDTSRARTELAVGDDIV